jgi:ATPase subunit of ABC transporter with duplicated ATPase domains
MTRVRLAALLAQSPAPEVLLLDEPTNHMDATNRERLAVFLRSWRGGLVIASHDRELLGHMDEIWDLSATNLKVYGGNYDAYAEQRAVEDAAAVATADAAKIALTQARITATQAHERQEQRQAEARRQAPNMGLPKILLGARKRRAEATSARLGGVHDKRVEAAALKQRAAAAAVRPDTSIRLSLPETQIPEGKVSLRLDDLQYAHPGAAPLWSAPLTTTVTGPRRVALLGDNGAGKTTLLRLLLGDLVPTAGSLMIGATPWAYLDQKLAGLDLSRTVLEMFRDATPAMNESDWRLRLGRLLLGPDHVMRPAGTLSGGERMRAALALALLGDRPAKLLVLDEPTNHLDLNSIACLEAALDGYQGALIVVSHDAAFRGRLRVDTQWQLDQKGLEVIRI